MKKIRNAIGGRIMRLRYEKKLSQPALAERCQRLGWDIARDTIAKIEDRRRWVGDCELVALAEALNVSVVRIIPDRRAALSLLREISNNQKPRARKECLL